MEWYEKRKPFWLHRCKPDTVGWAYGLFVSRCACGGIRMGSGSWLERNSR